MPKGDGLVCNVCGVVFPNRMAKTRHRPKCERDHPNADIAESNQPENDIHVHEPYPKADSLARFCVDCKVKYASYNFPNLPRRYCNKCQLPGMIDVAIRRCLSCDKGATFITPNSLLYCKDHKPQNASKIQKTRTCDVRDCLRTPVYSLSVDSVARACELHKLPGMHSKKKECEFKNCDRTPIFGFPTHEAITCKQHRTIGQVRHSTRRCDMISCTHFATHGFNVGEHSKCSLHASEGMTDMFSVKCKSCGMMSIVDGSGICESCDPSAFECKRLEKQNIVMEYIKNTTDYLTNPEFAARVDRQVLSGCIKQRPDIYIDLGDRILIIEIDEHQHRHMDVECERTRMFDIAQALGGIPVIFIRFNPDNYKSAHKMADMDTRLHLLICKMKDIQENWCPEVNVETSLSMAWCTYMFYDDRDDQIIRVK